MSRTRAPQLEAHEAPAPDDVVRSVSPAAPEGDARPAMHDDARGRDAMLARLRESTTSTAISMLGERAVGCPYIDAWFARHARTDEETLRRMFRRYAGLSEPANDHELFEAIQARLRLGIAYWQSGDDIAPELALAGLAPPGVDAISAAIAGDEVGALHVAAQLGEGIALPGAGDVRVHTDATTARLADRADAHAFAVGSDIVIGSSAPKPGTLAGDVLLAHELAHVAQQARGKSRSADSESEANAVAVRAASRGTLAGIGDVSRRAMTTPLSLQRCKRGKSPDKDAGTSPPVEDGATKDASVPDAPVDAALPPGMRSWVGSKIMTAPKTTVKGSEFANYEEIAKAYFGAKYFARFIELEPGNPAPTAIGPRANITVPASIEVPTPAEALPDPWDPASPAYQTWKVEEDPRGERASWKPTHPSANSGVTLGHGYDMKARKASEIKRELRAAGIDAALADRYSTAAGLDGRAADDWIAKHASIAAIDQAQERALFQAEYRATTDKTTRWLADPGTKDRPSRGYQKFGADYRLEINFAAMNPTILAFLVDLKFRGDLNEKSWGYIRDAVVANDLEKLRTLVSDRKNHRDYFYDNWIRYEARCRLVGAPVIGDEDSFRQ